MAQDADADAGADFADATDGGPGDLAADDEQAICGDGRVTNPEECDDGNRQGGDGCGPGCVMEEGWYCHGEPSTCESDLGHLLFPRLDLFAPYSLTPNADGTLDLALGNSGVVSIRISSEFSWPSGGTPARPLNFFGGSTSAQEPGWQVTIVENLPGQRVTILGEGGYYRLRRECRLEAGRIRVRDTFMNKTPARLAIQFINRFSPVPGAVFDPQSRYIFGRPIVPDASLSGYGRRFEQEDTANSTLFFSFAGNLGLGIYAEDDFFRNQGGALLWDDPEAVGVWQGAMWDPYFGLGAAGTPEESYTIEWSLYLLRSPAYWDFINQLRHDLGTANYPIENHQFLPCWQAGCINMEPEELREYFLSTSTRMGSYQICLYAQPGEIHPPQGPSIWEASEEIDSLIQNHYDRYRQTGLTLNLGLYIDLFLSSELDTQGRPPDPDPTKYSIPYPDSVVLGCPVPPDDPHAIPCNPRLAEPYATARPLLYFGLPVLVYLPTANNSWGMKLKEFQETLVEKGLDHIYLDESQNAMVWFTFDPQMHDGHSFRVDENTGLIDLAIGNVTILSEAYRMEFVLGWLESGFTLNANGPPRTRAFASLPIPRFAETPPLENGGHPDMSRAAKVHLTSPLFYPAGSVDAAEPPYFNAEYARGTKLLVAGLKHGVLFYPAGWVPDFYKGGDLYRMMFPITPVAIYAGTIIGQRQIVTVNSGLVGFGDASELEIVRYDSSGVRIAHDFGTEIAQGKSFARIGPLGHDEVVVVLRR